MKKLLEKSIEWIKKWFLPFLPFLVVGIIIVIKLIFKKNITIPTTGNFIKIPGKDNQILFVNKDGSFQKVQLPNGVKSSNIKVAVKATNGQIIVEKKHEEIDRRNSVPIDDNALDELGK